MKKTLLKSGIVLLVFIITILITSSIVNLDSTDMTTDMSPASFPVVSIEYSGTTINRMYGFTGDMELSYMRDSITPLSAGRKLHLKIDTYGAIVNSLKYEVRTVDGSRLIESTDISEYSSEGRNISADVTVKDLIANNCEYEFILFLTLGNGKTVKYFTRIIIPVEYHIDDKLEFVREFSDKTFDKIEATELVMYLESNSQGDNSSFGKVDIHSSFSQVSWGDLNPKRVTDPVITIRELAPMTGSFLVDYYVSIADEDLQRYYKVTEFFRVRYAKTRMYLLDYERTMDEVFEDNKASYEDQAIRLGITGNNVNLFNSQDGNSLAFETGGRLFVYNISENKMAYLFGFYDTFTNDERMQNPNHAIKVMNIDEDGNVTFLVYGYMNRGSHEGESSICAYYYDAGVNSIEELLSIPSAHAPDLLMKEIERISYMNSRGVLYLLSGSAFYAIDSKSRKVETIAENLAEGTFVISEDNRFIAWQQGDDPYNCRILTMMNLDSGNRKDIEVKANETIMPISFIANDLIYGIARKSDISLDRTGNTIVPMYCVNIENEKEGILMQYNRSGEGLYTVSGEVNGNQIMLHRVKKENDESFEEALDDQIMNSEYDTAKTNSLETENDELFEKITKIALKKDIQIATMKHLSPKMVLFEGDRNIVLNSLRSEEQYVVYGKYGVDSFYVHPGNAIERAYEIAGTVMNSKGEYIYTKTTRNSKNQIMAITEDRSTPERNSLAACIDTLLGYEGVVRNAQYLINQGETVLGILKEALPDYEILDLSGCTLDMVLYYVNDDIPVLALLDDGRAVLIIGFNETEVVLMDPDKGEIFKLSNEEAQERFENSGNGFITYVPSQEE